MGSGVFSIRMPNRSASLTDPPKSDPADLPLGPDQTSPPAARAVMEQGGPAVRRPSRTHYRSAPRVDTRRALSSPMMRET